MRAKNRKHGISMNRRAWMMALPPTALALAGAQRVLANENNENELAEASFTAESERSVARALNWITRTQNTDGGCGQDMGLPSDIGCSAMVGLALMSHGTTPLEGDHRRTLINIRKYILRATENMPSTDITTVTATQLQNKIGRHAHSFFAALFLSQIMGQGDNPLPVQRALQRVIAAIVRAQNANGDWGNQSWAPVLGTVMGWLSLRAADFAGLAVGAAPQKTADHLVKQMHSSLGNQGRSWMHALYKNATGIRVLYSMQMENQPVAAKAFKDVLNLVSKDNTSFVQAGGEEYLAFHLITETMLKKGGDDWNQWFATVRDKLINVQNQDGSWTGHHCITSRTFCTAASILVLTSPYRYLPISQA